MGEPKEDVDGGAEPRHDGGAKLLFHPGRVSRKAGVELAMGDFEKGTTWPSNSSA
jgi:hypothetical protein